MQSAGPRQTGMWRCSPVPAASPAASTQQCPGSLDPQPAPRGRRWPQLAAAGCPATACAPPAGPASERPPTRHPHGCGSGLHVPRCKRSVRVSAAAWVGGRMQCTTEPWGHPNPRRHAPLCPSSGCSCTPCQPMRAAVSITPVCAESMARTSGLSTRAAIHSRSRSVPCCKHSGHGSGVGAQHAQV